MNDTIETVRQRGRIAALKPGLETLKQEFRRGVRENEAGKVRISLGRKDIDKFREMRKPWRQAAIEQMHKDSDAIPTVRVRDEQGKEIRVRADHENLVASRRPIRSVIGGRARPAADVASIACPRCGFNKMIGCRCE